MPKKASAIDLDSFIGKTAYAEAQKTGDFVNIVNWESVSSVDDDEDVDDEDLDLDEYVMDEEDEDDEDEWDEDKEMMSLLIPTMTRRSLSLEAGVVASERVSDTI